MTQFSVQRILSLNYLSQFWGPLHNYDLLLYWTIVHKSTSLKDTFKDGFGGRSPLSWSKSRKNSQNAFYCHGAMHFFQEASELQKVVYRQEDKVLVLKQIREQIKAGHAPMFVCEGTSKQKLTKIVNNRYLEHCFEELGALEGSLFIFGHSGDVKDQHIFNQIAASKVEVIFVGVFDASQVQRANWQVWAEKLKARRGTDRPNGPPVDVRFFDSKSIELWGHSSHDEFADSAIWKEYL